MNAQYMLTAPRVTDTFFYPDFIITSADMVSSVKSEESVNPSDDLSFGGCVIPTVDFEMRDPGDTAKGIAGKSLVWYKNILTEQFTEKKLIVNNKVKMVAWNPQGSLNGNRAYVVSSTTPFVSIYDTDTMALLETVPDFTDTAPESLVVDGFSMYALYSKEPYAAKYNLSLNGDTPVLQATPTLSAYNIEQIKGMCQNRYCVCRSNSTGFTETRIDTKNGRPIAVVGLTYTEEKMGYFTAEKPEKVNGGKIKVRCNGWLKKFDVVVDQWLDGLTYPLTLKALVQSVCGKVGVTFVDSTFPNQDYPIQKNFVSAGLTALQVLRWAAELAGSFAWMDANGNLNFGWYESVDVTLESSAYMSITTAEYETLPIDRFQIRVVENDIGVITPPNAVGDNAYVIQDNPLAYTETDAELRPAVEALYARVEGLTYRPFELRTFQNPYVKAGSLINVAMPNGTVFTGYVMEKSTSGGMDTLIATGGQKRELQTDAVHQEIQQVRGTIHKLDMTVEGLRSTVESFGDNYVSTTTFETTVKGLRSEVSTTVNTALEGYVSNDALGETVEQLEKDTAENLENSLKSYVLTSTFDQTVNGITLEVSKKLNEDEFGTKLRVSAEDVQIAWNSIDRTIQFIDGSLQILNTDLPEDQQLLVKFDEIASHYYYKGYEVGRIGTNTFEIDGTEDYRGITFLLNSDGAYMAWSVQKEDDPDTSLVKIWFINKPEEMGYPRKGIWIEELHVGSKNDHVVFSTYSGGGAIWDTAMNHGIGPSGNLDGVCVYRMTSRGASAYVVFNQSNDIEFYANLNMQDYNIYNESDSRLKTNISETEVAAIHKIMSMDFKQFDWIESGNHEELGLIAQQVQTFFPEAVDVNEKTGVLSLNTTKFVMYALKAIQELGQFIDVPMPFANNSWEDEDTMDDKIAFLNSLPSRIEEPSKESGETLNSLGGITV